MAKLGDYCLWGKIDYIKEVAEGIQSISTPGHGGYKLDRKRNSMVHPAWRKKGGWYEEDCEYAIVWYTFPEAIVNTREHKPMTRDEVISESVYTLKNSYPDEYETVTGEKVTAEESRKVAEREFLAKHANDYIVVCAYGDWHKDVPSGMVGVEATLGGDRTIHGKRKYFLLPEDEYDTRDQFGYVIKPGANIWNKR